ncbi:MAG: ribosome small subunit-dependent GTPase A [Rubrivivax sp.]|nr:ribosome small subunit-dependent GTPase A [Rubrivivax sp.]MDP3222653.1 ribosome small subunit-dependent GTPase A [Rubrivivax sp.]
MIDSSAFERLRGIGLTPAVIQELVALRHFCTEPVLMRVTEVQREGIRLHDGGSEHAARLLPALRATLAVDGEAIAVGDWVLAQQNPLAEWWAHERVPPVNQLVRRLHDGRDKVTRAVIVSNVDTAMLVMGLDHDFSLRRLERFVALAQMARVTPLVVLTKADLCEPTAERVAQVQALLPPEASVVAVNALAADTRQALAPWLQPGQTLVLLGSSGTGKSTLTNTLMASEVANTGANRSGDSRGRHTTTARSLHATPHGACIIDTPGLRTLRLDGEAGDLGAAFSDIAQLAGQCRFRDCCHQDEPGCAVREHVPHERLKNYNKLLREARRDTLTALERKVQVQQWKARGRHARVRAEAKRG